MRYFIGVLLNKIAMLINAFIPAVLKPEDLLRFNKDTYSKPNHLEYFSSDLFVKSGLSDWENKLLSEADFKGKKVLVLFCGAGRECIYLAKQGYKVTGVDFDFNLIKRAEVLSREENLDIKFLKKEVTEIKFDFLKFDCCLCTFAMYETIPTREMRLKFLKRIYDSLNKNGIMIIDVFLSNFLFKRNSFVYKLNKFFLF